MGLNNASKAFNLPTVFNTNSAANTSRLSFVPPYTVTDAGIQPGTVLQFQSAFTTAYASYAPSGQTIFPNNGDILVSPLYLYIVWLPGNCLDAPPSANGIYSLSFNVGSGIYYADMLNNFSIFDD